MVVLERVLAGSEEKVPHTCWLYTRVSDMVDGNQRRWFLAIAPTDSLIAVVGMWTHKYPSVGRKSVCKEIQIETFPILGK